MKLKNDGVVVVVDVVGRETPEGADIGVPKTNGWVELEKSGGNDCAGFGCVLVSGVEVTVFDAANGVKDVIDDENRGFVGDEPVAVGCCCCCDGCWKVVDAARADPKLKLFVTVEGVDVGGRPNIEADVEFVEDKFIEVD